MLFQSFSTSERWLRTWDDDPASAASLRTACAAGAVAGLTQSLVSLRPPPLTSRRLRPLWAHSHLSPVRAGERAGGLAEDAVSGESFCRHRFPLPVT